MIQISDTSVEVPLFNESNNLPAEAYTFQPDAKSVSVFISHCAASHHATHRVFMISVSCRRLPTWYGPGSMPKASHLIVSHRHQGRPLVLIQTPAYSSLIVSASKK